MTIYRYMLTGGVNTLTVKALYLASQPQQPVGFDGGVDFQH